MNANDLLINTGATMTTGATGYGAQLGKTLAGADLNEVKDAIDFERTVNASREMEMNKGIKSSENKKVSALGYTVIFTKYDRNPYRPYYKSGLLLSPDFEGHEFYRSSETGEMERSEQGVICCHVIAVGPECKYLKEGDDIYIRNVGLAPVPFAGKGYWAVSEQNVICKIDNK